ncbi:hypothetical protein [Amnibacterium kyonggiense]|uniref:Uncharacterized protein n=1 Tax=Amnibacterium kyonggiense TaxID=595671 RepID=A0A4R7FQE9_9MICO|nr:hypothetical protein [Amnibacterium kyonggiense]TDS80002.1 hypothetical protein CLV52_0550 [Amnibacterium kyonggiense]
MGLHPSSEPALPPESVVDLEWDDFEILPAPGSEEVASGWTGLNQAIGIVSAQRHSSIAVATAALTSRAHAEHRSLAALVLDVLTGRASFDEASRTNSGKQDRVEQWYGENHRSGPRSESDEPIDADRWLYVHRDEVVGASLAAAISVIEQSGLQAHVSQADEDDYGSSASDAGRISLVVGHDGNVRAARWG